jgi:hypothetical protein
MSERPSFDSDSMIVAALAKAGKQMLIDEECRAAKKQTIIVDHGEMSVRVVHREDRDRWAKLIGAEALAVEPPQ